MVRRVVDLARIPIIQCLLNGAHDPWTCRALANRGQSDQAKPNDCILMRNEESVTYVFVGMVANLETVTSCSQPVPRIGDHV